MPDFTLATGGSACVEDTASREERTPKNVTTPTPTSMPTIALTEEFASEGAEEPTIPLAASSIAACHQLYSCKSLSFTEFTHSSIVPSGCTCCNVRDTGCSRFSPIACDKTVDGMQ